MTKTNYLCGSYGKANVKEMIFAHKVWLWYGEVSATVTNCLRVVQKPQKLHVKGQGKIVVMVAVKERIKHKLQSLDMKVTTRYSLSTTSTVPCFKQGYFLLWYSLVVLDINCEMRKLWKYRVDSKPDI